jgi:mannose-1-phosphate guanylyltransferase
MPVKAFLLAAGHGTRLRPITDTIPKCLVPIQGVPILALWLQCCKRVGIEEVLINLHAHAAPVREFLQHNGDAIPVRIVEEPELLGSAGTLRANRDWIGSDDLFWIFYADVLNRADLGGMLRLHRDRRPAATLGIYQVPDPRRCGIVTTNGDGVIEQFVEKPMNTNRQLGVLRLDDRHARNAGGYPRRNSCRYRLPCACRDLPAG